MKNILTKIPPFIYSLIFISMALISSLIYVLNHLDPENNSSKFLFALNLVLTNLVTVPTVRILFTLIEEDYPGDLRLKFRLFFVENILFSVFLGVLIVLKTYGFFTFTTLLALILIYLGISFGYKKLRKPRRLGRI